MDRRKTFACISYSSSSSFPWTHAFEHSQEGRDRQQIRGSSVVCSLGPGQSAVASFLFCFCHCLLPGTLPGSRPLPSRKGILPVLLSSSSICDVRVLDMIMFSLAAAPPHFRDEGRNRRQMEANHSARDARGRAPEKGGKRRREEP